MIDLNPNDLKTVQRILAEHVPECEVRAFGSRVTWTAKDYSDLDLAVVGTTRVDRRRLNRLADKEKRRDPEEEKAEENRIFDKIHTQGIHSLTTSEKMFLDELTRRRRRGQ